jgi:hypothetical protein
MPSTAADWWTTTDVAEYLSITPNSVRRYLRARLPKSNPFPLEDRRFGATLVWRPQTVVRWQQERPGRGNWR